MSEQAIENSKLDVKSAAPYWGRFAAALGRFPRVAALAVLLTVILGERYSRAYHGNQVDDAMTSIQYAKQLALGNGLVFNAGERVEGYTNFLWVVVMAPIYAFTRLIGVEFVPVMIRVNILISAAVVALVYFIAARAFGRRHLATLFAVALTVADNSFTVWAALGLEVHLLGLFMLLALWFAGSTGRRRALYAGLALLGAHLTRPDAGLFCAVLIGNELLEAVLDWRRKERGRALASFKAALTMTALWVLPYAAYFAWRFNYYGDLFPNTYYLKLEGEIDAWSRGLAYLASFLDERGYVPLLGLLAVFMAGDKLIRGLVFYLAAHVFYVTYVGGDFFPGHRFYVPEIPQFALLAGAGVAVLARLVERERVLAKLAELGVVRDHLIGFAFAASAFAVALVGLRGLALGPIQGEIMRWRDNLTANRRALEWVREHKQPNASMATCLIGHTGYYSETRVIDVCGVLDPVIAKRHVPNFGKGQAGHEKIAPADYILAKDPDFVALHVIHVDLWQHGYFLEAGIPAGLEGIWVKDPLPRTGRFLEHTRVNFDNGPPQGWAGRGTAFESWPTAGNWFGQGTIGGARGAFVNTYHQTLGTRATGRLVSPPRVLEGDRLVFRMAGGADAEKLTMSLLVNGEPVFRTTGRRGDLMSRRAWDIRPFRGQQGVIEIVDNATENWGYLAVDEIVEWVADAT